MNQLNEAYNMVKELHEIPAIETKLRELGYDEQEIPNVIEQICPDATAALNAMKDLMRRWENLTRRN